MGAGVGGGGVVSSSLGGGLGTSFSGAGIYGSTPIVTDVAVPAITTMAAPVSVTVPMMTEVVAAPAITAMAAPMTMATPMIEVVAAPEIITMAAPVTMATPMITEVIGSGGVGVYGSTMATPLATTYGTLAW